MSNTHYSLAFEPAKLAKWAEREAERLANLFVNTTGKPVLVYTGLSGVSTATALMLALDKYEVKYGMAYVRKTGENSHGAPVETANFTGGNYYMVFVDDFVCGGDTTRRCYKKMSGRYGKPTGIVFSMCRAGINTKDAIAEFTSEYGRVK